jgi:hypothetical protein
MMGIAAGVPVASERWQKNNKILNYNESISQCDDDHAAAANATMIDILSTGIVSYPTG